MSHIELVCVECGASHEADMHALGCESCGSPLDVSYLDRMTLTQQTSAATGCRCPITRTPLP